jgi:pimeloyl-ACP methyl ester carboxylesterase
VSIEDQRRSRGCLCCGEKYDLSFELTEPEAYRRDVPKAEVHILDAGHFALDTAADEIADLVRGFIAGKQ